MSLEAVQAVPPDACPTDDLKIDPPVEAPLRSPAELKRLIEQERDQRVQQATAAFQRFVAAWEDEYNVRLMPELTIRADGRTNARLTVELKA